MTFMVVDVQQLRTMFRLDGGDLFWSIPPAQHPDLRGKIAGSPMPNQSGKVYWAVQINRRKFKRSRIVFCLTHGRWPVNQIDHINGNSLDDRPENLREATATQNAWNHKRRIKPSGLPMGVKALASGRFQARIAVNKRKIALGSFETPEQAEQAYRAARTEYFGVWA